MLAPIIDALSEVWQEALTGIFTVVILPLIYRFARNRWFPESESKKAPRVQNEKLTAAADILKRVRAVRAQIGASRLYISALHNGSKLGIANLHYEKLSVVYEATDSVTAPTFGVVKDYPVLQFAPIILSMVNDGMHHRSMHDEPVGSESRLALESFQVHDEYMVPLRNRDGTVVGIVGAQYHSARHPFTEGEWAALRSLATFIEDSMHLISRADNMGASGVITWK